MPMNPLDPGMAGGSAMGGDVPQAEPGGFNPRAGLRPMAPRALHQAGMGPDMTHRFMNQARAGSLDTSGDGGMSAMGPGGSRYGIDPNSGAGDALRQVQERFQPVRDAREELMQARQALHPDGGATPGTEGDLLETRNAARQNLMGARQQARGGGMGGPGMQGPRMQSYRQSGRR